MVMETIEKVLNLSHRCDSCQAQAFVLVKGVAGELLFCGHHYNKHEKALEAFAYEVQHLTNSFYNQINKIQ